MTRDSVTYCTSGLVDRNKGSTLSWLHKSIKPLNQLMMIEDVPVIYRLSRNSERRIFYIDVGNLPKVKAEQYLRDVMMVIETSWSMMQTLVRSVMTRSSCP